MKRIKQYRIRLTEEEDDLLKQKAKSLGTSVADVIRMGINYQIDDLRGRKEIELRNNSEFIKNWEKSFEPSLFQRFERGMQHRLQIVYLSILNEYKGSVCYADGKFEVVSSINEVEESSELLPVVEEAQPEIVSEETVKVEICQSLNRFLGGEWTGDEWIVQIFLSGLKVDLPCGI